MAKKKTTEAINREQEAMEEKEALPSFFTNLFSSASNPLPNRAVLEYNIMHSAPVKANTEGYRAMMKVDKRTAEDIKHRLPCITPSVQLKGNSKKLTDFRKETYWLIRYAARGSPILGNSASEIFFYLSEIFPYLSEEFYYDSERFYSTRQKKEATDKNRLKRTNYDRRQKLREGRARHALLSHRYPQGSAQPAGEMDQPVPRAQAEPLFGLRRQVFPLLHPATSSRNHRISG